MCLYEANSVACEEAFGAGRRTLSIQDYMLGNKADAAFELLEKKGADLIAPSYIQEAISWIRA